MHDDTQFLFSVPLADSALASICEWAEGCAAKGAQFTPGSRPAKAPDTVRFNSDGGKSVSYGALLIPLDDEMLIARFAGDVDFTSVPFVAETGFVSAVRQRNALHGFPTEMTKADPPTTEDIAEVIRMSVLSAAIEHAAIEGKIKTTAEVDAFLEKTDIAESIRLFRASLTELEMARQIGRTVAIYLTARNQKSGWKPPTKTEVMAMASQVLSVVLTGRPPKP